MNTLFVSLLLFMREGTKNLDIDSSIPASKCEEISHCINEAILIPTTSHKLLSSPSICCLKSRLKKLN